MANEQPLPILKQGFEVWNACGGGTCLNKGMSEITIARLMSHTTTQLIGRYAKQTVRDLVNSYKSVLDYE